jgi:hypothetical protein
MVDDTVGLLARARSIVLCVNLFIYAPSSFFLYLCCMLRRKKAVNDQFAVMEEGRRRVHGAVLL